MEVEKDGVIPFLDVLETPRPNGRLGDSVYGKYTHTDRYLLADFHHHPAQKLSVVNSLVRHAISSAEPDKLSKELQHVKSSLQNNGYQFQNVQKVVDKHLHPSHADQLQDTENSEGIFISSFHSQNIKVVKPPPKIANIFPSSKDQVHIKIDPLLRWPVILLCLRLL
ncbi:hypothetical protein Trydic_g21346 [Trypoxylus dichotomus]